MRSLASFGTITRFSRIFGLVRVHMESTRAIALAFARDTRQVVQRFTHIIRPILAIASIGYTSQSSKAILVPRSIASFSSFAISKSPYTRYFSFSVYTRLFVADQIDSSFFHFVSFRSVRFVRLCLSCTTFR